MKTKLFILIAFLTTIVQSALAQTQTVVTSTIIGRSPLGLLIDLHIQDFVPADQALMYYNYLGVLCVIVWASFASMSNESRYAFTTPFFAAFLVFIGFLNPGSTSAASYWGIIIFCMLIGAFMYLNDMNHEKYGMAGPGDKLIATAFLIMCFTASFGFISSSQFGLFADSSSGASSGMCNTGQQMAYTCDSSGNIDLSASVTTVSSTGGILETIASDIYIVATVLLAMLKLAVIVFASVILFSGVIIAAYPVLLESPQAIAFLLVMNLVIWAIYYSAFFRWYAKPGPGEGYI